MKPPPSVAAALIGLIFMVPVAEAQLPKAPVPPAAAEPKAADSKAADAFRIEEVAALASVPVGQLKPRTIAFADHPPENLVDPGTGFMKYEEWAKARPLEHAQVFRDSYSGHGKRLGKLTYDGRPQCQSLEQ